MSLALVMLHSTTANVADDDDLSDASSDRASDDKDGEDDNGTRYHLQKLDLKGFP